MSLWAPKSSVFFGWEEIPRGEPWEARPGQAAHETPLPAAAVLPGPVLGALVVNSQGGTFQNASEPREVAKLKLFVPGHVKPREMSQPTELAASPLQPVISKRL